MYKYRTLNFLGNILHYRIFRQENTRWTLVFLRTEYMNFIKGNEAKLYSVLEKDLNINISLQSHFDLNDKSPVGETLLFLDLT